MRSHCGLYVDAGYLLASAATRLTGTSLRGGISVDYEPLVTSMIAEAVSDSTLPLLRVNWYDSAREGTPDHTQKKIGLLPFVKVRLGRIGFDGEQKGVDLRIGLDMVAHSRNGAVEVMYLVSGDDDLSEAVEEAQAQGVQVKILAVPSNIGQPHGLSEHLRRAADGLLLMSADALDGSVRKSAPAIAATIAGAPRGVTKTSPPPPATVGAQAAPEGPPRPSPALLDRSLRPSRPAACVPRTGDVLSPRPEPVYSSTTGASSSYSAIYDADHEAMVGEVVSRVFATWAATATAEQHRELAAGRPSIPRDVDRTLLRDLSEALGLYDVPDDIRFLLRAVFWREVDLPTVPGAG